MRKVPILYVMTVDNELYNSILNAPIIKHCIKNIIPNMQAG